MAYSDLSHLPVHLIYILDRGDKGVCLRAIRSGVSQVIGWPRIRKNNISCTCWRKQRDRFSIGRSSEASPHQWNEYAIVEKVISIQPLCLIITSQTRCRILVQGCPLSFSNRRRTICPARIPALFLSLIPSKVPSRGAIFLGCCTTSMTYTSVTSPIHANSPPL